MSEKIKLCAFAVECTRCAHGVEGVVINIATNNYVASHISSSDEFLKHDLGVTSDRNHAKYDELFGKDNWSICWSDIELSFNINTGI